MSRASAVKGDLAFGGRSVGRGFRATHPCQPAAGLRSFTSAGGSGKETAFDDRSAGSSAGKLAPMASNFPPELRCEPAPQPDGMAHATGVTLGTRSCRRKPRQRTNGDQRDRGRREGRGRRQRRANFERPFRSKAALGARTLHARFDDAPRARHVAHERGRAHRHLPRRFPVADVCRLARLDREDSGGELREHRPVLPDFDEHRDDDRHIRAHLESVGRR